VRVYYEDTDTSGFVYHAQYLKFAERARSEFLRHLDINQSDLQHAHGLFLVVHHLEMTYLKPAMLDNLLEIRTSLEKFTGVRFYMKQQTYHKETLLTQMSISIAAIDLNGRPKKIPEFLIKRIESVF